MTDVADTMLSDEQVDAALLAARARRALIDAPELVAHIRTLVVPLLGGAKDGMPRAASREAPAPARLDAVDVADEVYSGLIRWVVFWAAQFNRPMPIAAEVAYRREGAALNDTDIAGGLHVPHTALGLAAHVTPAGARALTESLTVWLLADHDVISDPDEVPAHVAAEYFTYVADVLWRARGQFPRAPRPTRGVLPRPCPACERFHLGAEWASEDPADFTIVCSFCGYTETAEAFIRERRVRELLTDLREERPHEQAEWWSKRQASAEMGITIRTIDRYIQSGMSTLTHEGTVYVRSADVQSLWREKRAAQVRSRKEAIVVKHGPEGAEHVGL
jgi:uncharacterized Zn finger protein (UPF0148 family)